MTPSDILAGLAETANTWRALAIAWHVYFGILIACLIAGLRPTNRTVGVLLALPLVCVGLLAARVGNPFNATVFGLGGAALIGLAAGLSRTAVEIAAHWKVASGVIMFIFGWVYPHFLDRGTWMSYVYSAPTGLIPCPTLAITIGLTLILDGLRSRGWSLALGAAGSFYGGFGALVLGVTMDLVLLLGAALLVGPVVVPKSWLRQTHSM